ncbi:MAG: helix-turn-helix domain-containing protein [Oscillospiraceae bacterium]
MSKAKKGAERNVFAIRLESLIKERGYINETVAKGVGVTRQAVGNWVNGDSVPDILTTIKLASFFNVSTDYLAGLTEIKSANPNIQSVCQFMRLSERAVRNLVGYISPNIPRYMDNIATIINNLLESGFLTDVATELVMLGEHGDNWFNECEAVIKRDGENAYYGSDGMMTFYSDLCDMSIFNISRLAIEHSKPYDKRESVNLQKRNVSTGELAFKKMKKELLAEMEAEDNGEHNPPKE